MKKTFTKKTYVVSAKQDGWRLDVLLSQSVLSRARVEKIIKQGLVRQKALAEDQLITKPSHRVKEGEGYDVFFPVEDPVRLDLKPYNFFIPVVYEDEFILVVNKPAGLPVHPGPKWEQKSLVNALTGKTRLSCSADPLRPGIVHRLDKNVSGLMILSKTELSRDRLIEGFKSRKIKRVYHALALGKLKKQQGRFKSFIGRHPKDRKRFYCFKESPDKPIGKIAITHYKALKSFKDKIHLMECQLETGRTHQIRVHLSQEAGLPLLGDDVYVSLRAQHKALSQLKLKNWSFERIALYSAVLELSHPITKKRLCFSLPWPEKLQPFLRSLNFL